MANNARDGWAEVDGLRTHYLKAGEGNAPVLLLHGGGYDSASLSYKHAIGSISRHHQVFAPDWPGYGQSDKPEIEYSTEYYVGFLGRLMDVLGLKKAILVDSHGLGREVPGRVASFALVRLPLLNKLVWAALGRSRRMVEWSLQSVFYDPRAVTRELVDEVFQVAKKPGAGQAWRSWQRNEIRWRGLRSNFVDRLHEVAAPTLILHGAEDKYVPVAWARRAHTMIKDSELHVLSQCGHWLTLENPGEFNRALSEFLLAE
jgi:pimeloyl-ACP methyl ester carboxylesterase